MYRHYDHHGEPNTKRASHPQVSSEDEGVDPTRRLRDIILGSENLLEYAQLGFQTLADGYHDDSDRPSANANQDTDETWDKCSPHWSRSSSYPSASVWSPSWTYSKRFQFS